MGLVSKKILTVQSQVDWGKAYVSTLSFFQDDDGHYFGVFDFIEGRTIKLPREPYYLVEGDEVTDYRIELVAQEGRLIIGEVDYKRALDNLSAFIVDADEEDFLMNPMNESEMYDLLVTMSI